MSASHPLVLLPGVMSDDAAWAPVVDRLSGASTMVPAYPAADDLGALADAVLDAAPERFDLAGHSMGGYIALEIMRRAADRVSRLALLSTSPFADGDDARANRFALVDKALAGGFDEIAAMMARFVIPKTAADAERLRADFEVVAKRTGADAFVAHQRAIAGRQDRTDVLPTIACPTLLVGAEDDKITPIEGIEALAAGIAGATTVRLPTGGHLPMWTEPDAVTEAMTAWRSRPI